MKIFVLDFSDNSALLNSLPEGHELTEEKLDGARAYKTTGEQMPDKIFINYKDKPSHGRQTALSIKERKKTAKIPIYFVGGTETENNKVAHLGTCISFSELAEQV